MTVSDMCRWMALIHNAALGSTIALLQLTRTTVKNASVIWLLVCERVCASTKLMFHPRRRYDTSLAVFLLQPIHQLVYPKNFFIFIIQKHIYRIEASHRNLSWYWKRNQCLQALIVMQTRPGKCQCLTTMLRESLFVILVYFFYSW